MAFSGSDEDHYVGAYFTGRRADDPAGEIAPPALLKAGEAPYNVLVEPEKPDARKRWSDYSYTTLDPSDDLTFWTIQEYAGADGEEDQWGTWIGQISLSEFDCNTNGTPDDQDIAEGTSSDCNSNGKPDDCEPDCNTNAIADTCEIAAGSALDCNSNGVPDSCDVAEGTSADDCGGGNGAPDECDFLADCNTNCIEDARDIAGGTSADCDDNDVPDSCEFLDCNTNGVFDRCDVSLGTSLDCDENGFPDECQPDCDSNGIPDVCEPDCNGNCMPDSIDIVFGVSLDTNTNGVPDECQNGTPPACIIGVVTRKTHTTYGAQDITVNIYGHVQDDPSTVTSEPRQRSSSSTLGGITELGITFDMDLDSNGPGDCPVTVWQQRKPVSGCSIGTADYVELYSGNSTISGSVAGNELIVTFSPGLENTRTYKIRVNTSVTSIASQTFEIRCLKADVNSSRRVDATDRSVVIGVWTGSGYSPSTDINLDGVTNSTDRSIVNAVWTNPAQHCAP